MRKIIFYILLAGILFTGCDRKNITISDSEIGNDIFYFKNSIKPFSGTCKINFKDTDNLKIKIHFKNGKMDGRIIVFYPNGSVKTRGFYKDGLQDGKWEAWFESGEKYYEAYYSNDSLNGEYIEFYENGVVKEKGLYTMNQKEKKWDYFDKSGMPLMDKLLNMNVCETQHTII